MLLESVLLLDGRGEEPQLLVAGSSVPFVALPSALDVFIPPHAEADDCYLVCLNPAEPSTEIPSVLAFVYEYVSENGSEDWKLLRKGKLELQLHSDRIVARTLNGSLVTTIKAHKEMEYTQMEALFCCVLKEDGVPVGFRFRVQEHETKFLEYAKSFVESQKEEEKAESAEQAGVDEEKNTEALPLFCQCCIPEKNMVLALCTSEPEYVAALQPYVEYAAEALVDAFTDRDQLQSRVERLFSELNAAWELGTQQWSNAHRTLLTDLGCSTFLAHGHTLAAERQRRCVHLLWDTLSTPGPSSLSSSAVRDHEATSTSASSSSSSAAASSASSTPCTATNITNMHTQVTVHLAERFSAAEDLADPFCGALSQAEPLRVPLRSAHLDSLCARLLSAVGAAAAVAVVHAALLRKRVVFFSQDATLQALSETVLAAYLASIAPVVPLSRYAPSLPLLLPTCHLRELRAIATNSALSSSLSSSSISASNPTSTTAPAGVDGGKTEAGGEHSSAEREQSSSIAAAAATTDPAAATTASATVLTPCDRGYFAGVTDEAVHSEQALWDLWLNLDTGTIEFTPLNPKLQAILETPAKTHVVSGLSQPAPMNTRQLMEQYAQWLLDLGCGFHEHKQLQPFVALLEQRSYFQRIQESAIERVNRRAYRDSATQMRQGSAQEKLTALSTVRPLLATDSDVLELIDEYCYRGGLECLCIGLFNPNAEVRNQTALFLEQISRVFFRRPSLMLDQNVFLLRAYTDALKDAKSAALVRANSRKALNKRLIL